MATVLEVSVRVGRRSEAVLLLFACAISIGARAFVDGNAGGGIGASLGVYSLAVIALAVAAHMVVRLRAPAADPILLPAAFALTGLGLAIIRRIDFAYAERDRVTHFADTQEVWAVVGIVGAMQAAEALKLLAQVGTSLAGRLLLLDALTMQWRELRVPRDPACPVCAARSS